MDYEKFIEYRNSTNPFARYVGVKVTKVAEGYAEGEVTIRPELLNPVGYVHGGCLYTMADVVTGAASAALGTDAVTVSGEYHYLAAAKDTKKVSVVSKCIKKGKTLLTFDVEVFDDKKKLIGKGIFTSYRLYDVPIVIK